MAFRPCLGTDYNALVNLGGKKKILGGERFTFDTV